MQRFLIIMTITFGLCMAGAWYWVANDYFKFADADYAMWLAKKLMLDNCEVGTLAIIGDSRAETSIVPSRVGPKVVNFGLEGASMMTMLEVSRHIVSCPEPPKAVLITLDPKRFLKTDLFWEREARYNLFSLDYDEIRRRAKTMGNTLLFAGDSPFDAEERLKATLIQMRFPSYYFAAILAGYGFLRESQNKQFLQDTLQDKGYHYLGERVGDARAENLLYMEHFKASEFFESYFADMLDLYAAHNIPVYFASAPFKSTIVRFITPSFKYNYRGYLAQWEKAYPGFHVIGDVMPLLPPDDFSDVMHLNSLGAAQWSAQLSVLLAQAGVDTGGFFSVN